MAHTFIWLIALMAGLVVSAQQKAYPDSLYLVQDSVSIPTRSGIEISAMVVRKKANPQPLPAILFYTTYDQGRGDAILGKRSAERDYVGIVAYARGIRTDWGQYAPYEHEATDIHDIIAWIAKQPWCNGQVGMLGGSYTGFSQWAATKQLHPALRTIVPQVAVMPGFDTPMENNVQLNLGLYWPNDNIYKREPIRRSLPFEWFETGIAWDRLDSLAGQANALFQKWLRHPSYDAYWQAMVPTAEEYARLDIPVLTTTGYYDGSQIGALRYFQLHKKNNPKAEHYLVIGPYDHWGGQRQAAKNLMGYEIDPVAEINMGELAYDWLDHILKGGPKPALLRDRVNFQVMGSNRWRHAPDLQRINNDTLTFYLDQDGLSLQRPRKKAHREQIVDFAERGDQNNFYTPEIVFDTLDASQGLTYVSKPFSQDFSINGSFTGALFATIDKKDMDLSLALYEVMPDGRHFFLTRYLGRASYARDNTQRRLLRPGRRERIPLGSTRFVSKRIAKGSRLKILLNINKHPFEIINYGSGKPVVQETMDDAKGPLHIQWHNRSHIQVPITRD